MKTSYDLSFVTSPVDQRSDNWIGQQYLLSYLNSEQGTNYIFRYKPFSLVNSRIDQDGVLADMRISQEDTAMQPLFLSDRSNSRQEAVRKKDEALGKTEELHRAITSRTFWARVEDARAYLEAGHLFEKILKSFDQPNAMDVKKAVEYFTSELSSDLFARHRLYGSRRGEIETGIKQLLTLAGYEWINGGQTNWQSFVEKVVQEKETLAILSMMAHWGNEPIGHTYTELKAAQDIKVMESAVYSYARGSTVDQLARIDWAGQARKQNQHLSMTSSSSAGGDIAQDEAMIEWARVGGEGQDWFAMSQEERRFATLPYIEGIEDSVLKLLSPTQDNESRVYEQMPMANTSSDEVRSYSGYHPFSLHGEESREASADGALTGVTIAPVEGNTNMGFAVRAETVWPESMISVTPALVETVNQDAKKDLLRPMADPSDATSAARRFDLYKRAGSFPVEAKVETEWLRANTEHEDSAPYIDNGLRGTMNSVQGMWDPQKTRATALSFEARVEQESVMVTSSSSLGFVNEDVIPLDSNADAMQGLIPTKDLQAFFDRSLKEAADIQQPVFVQAVDAEAWPASREFQLVEPVSTSGYSESNPVLTEAQPTTGYQMDDVQLVSPVQQLAYDGVRRFYERHAEAVPLEGYNQDADVKTDLIPTRAHQTKNDSLSSLISEEGDVLDISLGERPIDEGEGLRLDTKENRLFDKIDKRSLKETQQRLAGFETEEGIAVSGVSLGGTGREEGYRYPFVDLGARETELGQVMQDSRWSMIPDRIGYNLVESDPAKLGGLLRLDASKYTIYPSASLTSEEATDDVPIHYASLLPKEGLSLNDWYPRADESERAGRIDTAMQMADTNRLPSYKLDWFDITSKDARDSWDHESIIQSESLPRDMIWHDEGDTLSDRAARPSLLPGRGLPLADEMRRNMFNWEDLVRMDNVPRDMFNVQELIQMDSVPRDIFVLDNIIQMDEVPRDMFNVQELIQMDPIPRDVFDVGLQVRFDESPRDSLVEDVGRSNVLMDRLARDTKVTGYDKLFDRSYRDTKILWDLIKFDRKWRDSLIDYLHDTGRYGDKQFREVSDQEHIIYFDRSSLSAKSFHDTERRMDRVQIIAMAVQALNTIDRMDKAVLLLNEPVILDRVMKDSYTKEMKTEMDLWIQQGISLHEYNLDLERYDKRPSLILEHLLLDETRLDSYILDAMDIGFRPESTSDAVVDGYIESVNPAPEAIITGLMKIRTRAEEKSEGYVPPLGRLVDNMGDWDKIRKLYSPGVDILDVPDTEYDYEQLASTVYNLKTGVPHRPLSPTNVPDVKVKTPLHHPIGIYSEIGLDDGKELAVDNAVFIEVLMAIETLKSRNTLRFAGMPAQKTVQEVFSKLYTWIQQSAPDDPQFMRMFRFARWYGEAAVTDLSQHVLHRIYNGWRSSLHKDGELGMPFTEINWPIRKDARILQTNSTSSYLRFEKENYIDAQFIVRGHFDNPLAQGTMEIKIDGKLVDTVSVNGVFTRELAIPQGNHIYEFFFEGASGVVSLSMIEIGGSEFISAHTTSDDSDANGLRTVSNLMSSLLGYYDKHHVGGKTKGTMEVKQRRVWNTQT